MKEVRDMAYIDKEKIVIIKRLDEGDSIKDICNEYGVSRNTLYQPEIGTYYSTGWKSWKTLLPF